MKKAVVVSLLAAGVLSVSSAALADFDFKFDLGSQKFETIAMTQEQNMQKPPAMPSGDKRPPRMMSGDRRPPEPPDGKRPPMSGDKRPPRPLSGDKKPPEKPKDLQ